MIPAETHVRKTGVGNAVYNITPRFASEPVHHQLRLSITQADPCGHFFNECSLLLKFL